MDNKIIKNEKQNKDMVKKNNRDLGFFDPFFDGFFGFPNFKDEFKQLERVMKTDVSEDEHGYSLEIEMPGYDKKDIKLDINNGYLSIEARQSEENNEKDKKGNYIRRERHYGSCARSFYVGDVKEEDISAKLDKGILHVYVPKQAKSEKKHIEIQ